MFAIKKIVGGMEAKIYEVTHENGSISVMSYRDFTNIHKNFSDYEIIKCSHAINAILHKKFVNRSIFFNMQKECKDFKQLSAPMITATALIDGFNFFEIYGDEQYFPEHNVLKYLCLEGDMIPCNLIKALTYFNRCFSNNWVGRNEYYVKYNCNYKNDRDSIDYLLQVFSNPLCINSFKKTLTEKKIYVVNFEIEIRKYIANPLEHPSGERRRVDDLKLTTSLYDKNCIEIMDAASKFSIKPLVVHYTGLYITSIYVRIQKDEKQ